MKYVNYEKISEVDFSEWEWCYDVNIEYSSITI